MAAARARTSRIIAAQDGVLKVEEPREGRLVAELYDAGGGGVARLQDTLAALQRRHLRNKAAQRRHVGGIVAAGLDPAKFLPIPRQLLGHAGKVGVPHAGVQSVLASAERKPPALGEADGPRGEIQNPGARVPHFGQEAGVRQLRTQGRDQVLRPV